MSNDPVMIHVRFAPDGAVTEIGERPEAATPATWFNHLSGKVGESFQPLSGGRGIFRVAREEMDSLKASLLGA
jgi:hypothetical protein